MTQSVYVVGGAGSGKSTFVAQLLDHMELSFGPVSDLHSYLNGKVRDTLRGHYLTNPAGARAGVYLGVNRPEYPGCDALARSISPTAMRWVAERPLPPFIVGEGYVLGAKPFLNVLHEYTSLMVVRLYADPDVIAERFAARGSKQPGMFVKNTGTRARNAAEDVRAKGANVLTIDTDDTDAWDMGLDLVQAWVLRC